MGQIYLRDNPLLTEPLTLAHVKARLLGYWGTTPGLSFIYVHLNGYKIANPSVLARISHEELESLFIGYGYRPYFVEGYEPAQMHQRMAATLDTVIGEIRTIQNEARTRGTAGRPRWPMIILRTPKGWTGPGTEQNRRNRPGSWAVTCAMSCN